MIDEWRSLLYPLGFLSSLAFGGRILSQWLTSEIKKESVVTKTFWRLSLVGNILLLIHSLIQVQYHVFIIQVGNAIISWRNLNLMQLPALQIPKKKVYALFLILLPLSTFIFLEINDLWNESLAHWFRVPTLSWLSASKPIPDFWHIIGFSGLVLFSSRFWIQWWCAEKKQESYLGPLFWWISLVGDLLTLVYFAKIKDPVNLIGPVFGLVPYIRNLMLLQRAKTPEST